MDFNEWTLAPDGRSASHSCGFTLSVEGNPRDPQGVNPGRFPPHLSVIDQARLLRHGVEAIAKGAQRPASVKPKPQAGVKPAPDRPVLSIKRNNTDTETPA
ncbi:hypothetical protein [Simiduia litorea]|uniref:hypothetical protein n=1 Tax=Simiduia litorea TaxID=1435348 RepID=UPI0036F35586